MGERTESGEPPRAAVVVVNYGSHGLVEANLARTLAGVGDTIGVVVDNFSDAAERAAIDELCRRRGWLSVLSDANEGFGAGVRRGVEAARGTGVRSIVMLNPDAWMDPADLQALVAHTIRDPRVLVAPLVVRPDGTVFADLQDLYLADGTMRASRARPADVPADAVMTWVSGACAALSVELWDASGGFDDDYFLYWEDVDLSARVWAAGGTVEVDRTLRATHDEGGTHGFSTAGRAKSPIYYYYNVRNRYLFAAKHLDEDSRRRWRRSARRVARSVLLQGGRAQFVHPARTVLPAWRALRDGRRWRQEST